MFFITTGENTQPRRDLFYLHTNSGKVPTPTSTNKLVTHTIRAICIYKMRIRVIDILIH